MGRGQSLVEFAIVLPLLVLMLMGVIEVGRILFAYIALEEAVHEGAVYAAHDPSSTTLVSGRVTTSSNHAEVAGASVAPLTCTSSPAPGTVTVTASYDLPTLTPVGTVLFGGTFRLSATVVGTNLTGAC